MRKLRKWRTGFGCISTDQLAAFHGCDQLEEMRIEIGDAPITPECIAALKSLTRLQRLSISGAGGRDWKPILQALSALPCLEKLRLVGITDGGLQTLPELRPLRTLDLSLSTVGSVQGLSSLKRLPSLRHLALHHVHAEGSGLGAVAECASLESLVFAPNQADRFLEQHDGVGKRSSPGFRPADLRPVLEKTRLQVLHVEGLGFGDELMQELPAGKHLRVLGLDGLPITDNGFLQLLGNSELTRVNITGTQVSSEAAKQLYDRLNAQCSISDNWCCGCMAYQARSE